MKDADCNGSSSAGILGVMLGYSEIPDKFKLGFDKIENTKFDNTNYRFNDIVRSTLKRAFQLIQNAGGKISGTDVEIPFRKPVAAKFEQFNMGKPVKIISTNDPSWKWKGSWQNKKGVVEWRDKYNGKLGTGDKNQQAELTFSGTAVLLLGINSENGGKADVFIDGREKRGINSYVAKDTFNDALWHIYGLRNGKHTLKIVMRNDADPFSNGKEILILGGVVYK